MAALSKEDQALDEELLRAHAASSVTDLELEEYSVPVSRAAAAPTGKIPVSIEAENEQVNTPAKTPNLELGRAAWHASVIVTCGLLCSVVKGPVAYWLITFSVLLLVVWEVLRRRDSQYNFQGTWFGPLIRQEEIDGQICAGTWYTLGLAVVYLTMPMHVTQVTLFMVGVSDPTARICGKLWGKRKLPFSAKKTWLGAGGCLASALLVGLAGGWFLGLGFWVVLVGACVATAAEALPDRRWLPSDNFRMTVLTGLAMNFVVSHQLIPLL